MKTLINSLLFMFTLISGNVYADAKEEAEKKAWPLRNLVACSFPYSKDTALSMVSRLANLAINNPQGFGYAMTSGSYKKHCKVVNGSPNPAFFANAKEIQHKQDEDSYQDSDGRFVIGHKNDISYFVSVNDEGIALAFYGRGCFNSGYWKPCTNNNDEGTGKNAQADSQKMNFNLVNQLSYCGANTFALSVFNSNAGEQDVAETLEKGSLAYNNLAIEFGAMNHISKEAIVQLIKTNNTKVLQEIKNGFFYDGETLQEKNKKCLDIIMNNSTLLKIWQKYYNQK